MNLDGLFSGSKWEIVEHLSKKSSTLTEISKSLKTSVANVSQQVRFLEFAGIVSRERAQKSTAGKPESTLKLVDGFSYIVVATGEFCKKSLVHIDAFQNLMLYSWVELEGKERESFESFLVEHKKDLERVERVYVGAQMNGLPRRAIIFLNTPNVSKKTYGSLDFLFFEPEDNFDSVINGLKKGKKEEENFILVYKKNKQDNINQR